MCKAVVKVKVEVRVTTEVPFRVSVRDQKPVSVSRDGALASEL